MKRLVYATTFDPIEELENQYPALSIKYTDDDYVVGDMYGTLCVYHYITYPSPRFGTPTSGWLSCGRWVLRRDNLWHKDLTSHYSESGTTDYAEIIEYEKECHK